MSRQGPLLTSLEGYELAPSAAARAASLARSALFALAMLGLLAGLHGFLGLSRLQVRVVDGVVYIGGRGLWR